MRFKFNVGQMVKVIDVITKDFSSYLGQTGRVVEQIRSSGYVDGFEHPEYRVKFRDPPLPEMIFEEYELERGVQG